MPESIALMLTSKTYADRGVKRGREIKTMMREAFGEVMPDFVRHIQRTYLSGPTSPISISKRKGNIRANTTYTPYETPSGVGVHLEIGQGVPYASLHVGSTGEYITMVTAKRFVIPFPEIRNKDGSWRSPYRPGNLRGVKGLFRRKDILYQRMADGSVLPRFVLKQMIRVPQRVDIRSIEGELRPRLLQSMRLAFDGYDYGYLRMMRSE